MEIRDAAIYIKDSLYIGAGPGGISYLLLAVRQSSGFGVDNPSFGCFLLYLRRWCAGAKTLGGRASYMGDCQSPGFSVDGALNSSHLLCPRCRFSSNR